MTFGDDWGWGAVKDEERKVYDAFRDAGGNFVDTPNIYTNGTSEPFLGEFMKDHRQSVVLATKYTNAHPGEIRRSMAQVALAWLATALCRSCLSSARESFLSCNLASFDLTLSANHLKTLEEASRIEFGFPDDFYAKEMVRAIL
jgi:aryl-alcohol dehydrogenase-like predicted oxidoreductase